MILCPAALPPPPAYACSAPVVSQGRILVRVDDREWSVGEGDSLAVPGPAEAVVLPCANALAIAHIMLVEPARESTAED